MCYQTTQLDTVLRCPGTKIGDTQLFAVTRQTNIHLFNGTSHTGILQVPVYDVKICFKQTLIQLLKESVDIDFCLQLPLECFDIMLSEIIEIVYGLKIHLGRNMQLKFGLFLIQGRKKLPFGGDPIATSPGTEAS